MHNIIRNMPTQTPLATLFLAHGAGAPMDSDFMETISTLLCQRGCEVVRFEFPYMAERRKSGKKSPPNRTDILLDTWRQVLAEQCHTLASDRPLLIGGKSLGGRMASMVADELEVDGLVCLGYPFHPPGKPENLRTEHLQRLTTPTLIVQGTRDPLGNAQEVSGYALPAGIQIQWLPDGDHDFKPRVKSGYTQAQHWEQASDLTLDFIHSLTKKSLV
ncbi:alpha/beta family hydrolase [Cellvibrio sp. ARAG 10.3]|uniref:alpha/beta family hydrolase n=1 Tax=Cellvibrio sp. ARAG 10.3 TaxID=3451358 RepID=UPI003F6E0D7F